MKNIFKIILIFFCFLISLNVNAFGNNLAQFDNFNNSVIKSCESNINIDKINNYNASNVAFALFDCRFEQILQNSLSNNHNSHNAKINNNIKSFSPAFYLSNNISISKNFNNQFFFNQNTNYTRAP